MLGWHQDQVANPYLFPSNYTVVSEYVSFPFWHFSIILWLLPAVQHSPLLFTSSSTTEPCLTQSLSQTIFPCQVGFPLLHLPSRSPLKTQMAISMHHQTEQITPETAADASLLKSGHPSWETAEGHKDDPVFQVFLPTVRDQFIKIAPAPLLIPIRDFTNEVTFSSVTGIYAVLSNSEVHQSFTSALGAHDPVLLEYCCFQA